jgi:hypothetical protein
MLTNFTVHDTFGSIEAALLLGLFLFVPGYVIGWATNVFAFRQRRTVTQLALSTPLAVAVVPIVVYLLGRYPAALWSVFAGAWICFVLIIVKNQKRLGNDKLFTSSCEFRLAICFAALWAVVALASLVDLQFRNGLYFSVPAYDYSLRTAITAEAALRIPPANPFFASSPPVPLKYHYFWMLICSLPVRLAHISPRLAMYGGTIWAGVILMSLVAIALKFFIRVRENIERKVLIGCGLLLVTGLDILPILYMYFHHGWILADMEWWDTQITSWLDALLWTPHHLMGLVACMVGFLVLREPVLGKRQRFTAVALAGFAFASAAGLSVLVTFTFVIFVLMLLLVAILRRWRDDIVGFCAAGAIALLLAFPFLKTLTMASGASGGGAFAVFSVRDFPLAALVLATTLKLNGDSPILWSHALLPVSYFLELGFFFLVGVFRLNAVRSGRLQFTRTAATAWLMVLSSFLVGTFLRSTTIGSNDLGWRCFLLAQFVLLLWGALLVDDWWFRPRPVRSGFWLRLAQVCVVLGVIGTVYQVTMLRIYPLLHDYAKADAALFDWVYPDQKVGERTFALRSAYERLSQVLPADSIVQYNPYAISFISHEIYSDHEAAVGSPDCATAFGGNSNICGIRFKEVMPFFVNPTPSQNVAVDDLCRQYGISGLLVDNTDEVWSHPGTWVWTRTPLFSNEYVRAFVCGDAIQRAGLKAAR